MELEKLKNKTVLLSTYINTASDETYALFGPIENITGYLSHILLDYSYYLKVRIQRNATNSTFLFQIIRFIPLPVIG